MKRSTQLLFVGLAAATIAGCSFSALSPSGTSFSSSSVAVSSTSSDQMTVVTYEGTLQKDELGSADGTHRLSMGEGLFLALQSSSLNLDEYVGQEVKVTGTVSSSLSGAGKIMEVSQIISVLQSMTGSDVLSSVSSSTSSVLSSSSTSSLPSSVASSVPQATSSKPTVKSSSSAAKSSVPAVQSSSSSSVEASVPGQPNATILAAIKTMAKTSVDAGTWTQKYCTSYVGFCFPFHKNWYYKSFGAKTASLWHVEMSSAEIENVGDGPIAINFVSGDVPSGVTDSTVVVSGDTATGFRQWTGKRHFEISAPVALQSAVQYITEQIATYEPPMSP